MRPINRNIVRDDEKEEDMADRLGGPRSVIKLKFRTELEKATLIQNFEKRGWSRAMGDDKWNIYWGCPFNVYKLFDGHRLTDMQLVNHFPNSKELTRKDLMVKNIKRFRREMEKENNPIADRDDSG